MLTPGGHYPTMVLDYGTQLFFFSVVYMCEISDDVLWLYWMTKTVALVCI